MKIVVCDSNDNALCKLHFKLFSWFQFFESSKLIAGLLQQRAHCPSLAILVVMETPSEEVLTLARKDGVQLLTFDDLEDLGKHAQVQ